jgi:hypothetical protein
MESALEQFAAAMTRAVALSQAARVELRAGNPPLWLRELFDESVGDWLADTWALEQALREVDRWTTDQSAAAR